MTVDADQLALFDLCQDPLTAVALHESADVVDLVLPGKMIPAHGGWVKPTPTISARTAFLQPPIPGDKLFVSAALLSQPALANSHMVCRIVGSSARLAPCLIAARTPVKVRHRLEITAPSASFH